MHIWSNFVTVRTVATYRGIIKCFLWAPPQLQIPTATSQLERIREWLGKVCDFRPKLPFFSETVRDTPI